jgi:nucleoside-diphosphate-sugar epimerase
LKILVTGAAGFIGMHVSKWLSEDGYDVIGIDNINSYYETSLKYGRLGTLGIKKEDIFYNKEIQGQRNFRFFELDLTDAGSLMAFFVDKGQLADDVSCRADEKNNNPKMYLPKAGTKRGDASDKYWSLLT